MRAYNKNWGLVEQLLGGDYTDMVLALENQCVLVMYASQRSGFIVYNIRDCDVQKCNKEQRYNYWKFEDLIHDSRLILWRKSTHEA